MFRGKKNYAAKSEVMLIRASLQGEQSDFCRLGSPPEREKSFLLSMVSQIGL